MRGTFLDRSRLAFDDHRTAVTLGQYHRPPIKSPGTLVELHYLWDHCQVCGRSKRVIRCEIHHLAHGIGGAGRSDESCNLIMLCVECHEWLGHGGAPSSWADGLPDLPRDRDERFGLLLWAKWHTDQATTDWRRLAELRQSYLPDLYSSQAVLETYRRNRRLRLP